MTTSSSSLKIKNIESNQPKLLNQTPPTKPNSSTESDEHLYSGRIIRRPPRNNQKDRNIAYIPENIKENNNFDKDEANSSEESELEEETPNPRSRRTTRNFSNRILAAGVGHKRQSGTESAVLEELERESEHFGKGMTSTRRSTAQFQRESQKKAEEKQRHSRFSSNNGRRAGQNCERKENNMKKGNWKDKERALREKILSDGDFNGDSESGKTSEVLDASVKNSKIREDSLKSPDSFQKAFRGSNEEPKKERRGEAENLLKKSNEETRGKDGRFLRTRERADKREQEIAYQPNPNKMVKNQPNGLPPSLFGHPGGKKKPTRKGNNHQQEENILFDFSEAPQMPSEKEQIELSLRSAARFNERLVFLRESPAIQKVEDFKMDQDLELNKYTAIFPELFLPFECQDAFGRIYHNENDTRCFEETTKEKFKEMVEEAQAQQAEIDKNQGTNEKKGEKKQNELEKKQEPEKEESPGRSCYTPPFYKSLRAKQTELGLIKKKPAPNPVSCLKTANSKTHKRSGRAHPITKAVKLNI